MKGLWKYLLSPSPDTSGVANIFRGIGEAMLVFDDVHGCATNYMAYDELRRFETRNVMGTRMGEIDAILGTSRQIQKTVKEHIEIYPDTAFGIIVGSPISTLIGTDLIEVAKSLESEYKIPFKAISVTGHETYEIGISKALLTLYEIVRPPKSQKKEKYINLIGYNGLDLGYFDKAALIRDIEAFGYRILSIWGDNTDIDHLKEAGQAQENWVMSMGGMALARQMKEEMNIPFRKGIPISVLEKIGRRELSCSYETKINKILIIGDDIVSTMLGKWLSAHLDIGEWMSGSFFSIEDSVGDSIEEEERYQKIHFQDEDQFKEFIQSNPIDLLIGDPLMKNFKKEKGNSQDSFFKGTNKNMTWEFVPLVHPAFSGRLFLQEDSTFQVDCFIEEIVKLCKSN